MLLNGGNGVVHVDRQLILKRRKILFLVSSMNCGGAERVASTLINAWAARGDSVVLCITYSGRGSCFYHISECVQLVFLSDLVKGRARGISGYWRRFLALRRLIRETRPDTVISFLTNVNVAAILASIGLHCRIIVSERSYPPQFSVGFGLAFLRRLTYPLADCVTMMTGEGLDWLAKHIPESSGAVVPNPVAAPLPVLEPVRDPDLMFPRERKVLLGVGRLDSGKQFDLLLKSFAHLAPDFPSWTLVIIGEGPDCEALKVLATEAALDGRVFFLGKVGNMSDWYSRADLYVMTSRFEGFPNTLAEAMAHGCAAISYDCDTGPRDIIRHGHDGLLVRPVGDVPGLTAALQCLMADDVKRNELAARAVEVRERYSLDRILTLWDELFNDLKVTAHSRKHGA